MRKVLVVLGLYLLFMIPVGYFLSAPVHDGVQLLHVSYDPTRELYQDVNALFVKQWEEKTGQKVHVLQSHGGSGKQARSIIDGLRADVATLALSHDIDMISQRSGFIDKGWTERFPYQSSPYHSTIVFLVRKGNPKNIKDWDDLVRDDVSVITPNPKASGGARWNYLGGWAYAMKAYNGDKEKSKEYLAKLYRNVPILDTAARGSTITFARRGIGDVLISWENEAFLAIEELGKGKFDIVFPSMSVLADLPVAMVDRVVNYKETKDVATAYLNFLYEDVGQHLIAKHYYRPTNPKILKEYAGHFPDMPLVSIKDLGGWEKVEHVHFADGGIFDQIYGVD